MQTKNRIILPLAMILLPATHAAAFEKKEIQLAEAPAAVQSVVRDNLRGGTLDEIERVTFDGRTTYLAEINLAEDRDLDLYISEDGTIHRTAEEIHPSEAPDAVRGAAESHGTIEEIDKHTRGGTVTYRVEIDRPGADLMLEISEAGAVLSQTEESDD